MVAYTAAWWLWVELLGLIALPLCLHLFRSLPDRGYAFGKALGILIPSYLLWIAATAGILPNSRLAIMLLVAITAACSFFVLWRSRDEISDYLRLNWKTVLATELVFTLFFLVMVMLKSYSPEIQHTEQPMDFALLNGILRSEHFPPNDPWLSGSSISYYYFGYLMMAVLSKLSAIPSSISYNLSLSLIFALAASGAFSLVYNLVRAGEDKAQSRLRPAIIFGLIAALFLVVIGNLEGFLELLYAHNIGSAGFWQWIGINNLNKPYSSGGLAPDQFWWWWRATRVISVGGETISEFPIFSFLLGDMHPHVLSLPFVMMALALSLNIFLSPVRVGLRWIADHVGEFVLVIIAIGSLGFINSWDLPVFLAVFVCAAAMNTFKSASFGDRSAWRDLALFSVCVLTGSVFLYLPYYLGPHIPILGIWIVQVDTPYRHYGIIWGLFFFVAVSLVVYCAIRWLRAARTSWPLPVLAALIALGPFLLWAFLQFMMTVLISGPVAGLASDLGKLAHLLPLFVVLFAGVWALLRRLEDKEEGPRIEIFALLLALMGLYLTMGVELFYIRDVFGNRMNTVFKLYYQAWALLAVGCAFGVYYVGVKWRVRTRLQWLANYAWWVALVVLVIAASAYPVMAAYSRSDAFKPRQTIDGLAWMQQNPDEYEAIRWLQQNVSGSPTIVEAVGGSYSEYARVSSSTGLPAVLGWPGHEQQWRSSSAYAGREQDVASIYQSSDAALVQSILRKYNVSYVYAGALERQKYPSGDFVRFDSFMDVVFRNKTVTIYRTK